MNSLELFQESFFKYLQNTFSLSEKDTQAISITLNTDPNKEQFGDFNTNAALILAPKLGKNARLIAETIRTEFNHEFLASTEIAGPGFVNFFLTPQTFSKVACEILEQKDYFFTLSPKSPKKNISVEFVSANPTGPLHIGHGRGGIIGDVLSNVLRFLGHTVTKEFYINDAGSQIKKLGISLKIRCQQALGIQASIPEDGYHGDYLQEVASQCITTFGADVLEKSDDFFALYAKDMLLEKIKKTLAEYGIYFDVWFSEKILHESGAIPKAFALLQEKGFLYAHDNALWFKSTAFGDDKDRVVQKSSGEFTYAAADIAYLENKLLRGFDTVIFVLGQDHHSYVNRLKGIMAALGNNPEDLDVILYQLVTLKNEGELVRMSKRAGTMVTLQDIINTVGKDVARFFYLNRKADAHLDFDIGLALTKTEENPVYYVQYAYVRTKSILDKAAKEPTLSEITYADILDLTKQEHMLIKKIVSLKSMLVTISNNYQTHLLAYYLLELATMFHSYYSKNRVINMENIPQSRARLALIQMLHNTLGLSLNLLGLTRVEAM